MSAHEHPAVPDSDQPPTEDSDQELEEIARLREEMRNRVSMLRDERPSGVLGHLRDALRRVRARG